MYINWPKHNFLAVTKSKELYCTYDNFNSTICKSVHEFLVCPPSGPILYILGVWDLWVLCEILLMQEPREVPVSYEIRHVEMAITTVFYKLKHKNEWLYITNNGSVFVTCEEDKKSRNHINILKWASIKSKLISLSALDCYITHNYCTLVLLSGRL